ncbi:hypothetical protein [Sphingorhabdus sp.]|uniref:hypothetical protein n=1 Tax=Sphingorhabdus sp. TaxID=1902408 RepID=UPI003341DE09
MVVIATPAPHPIVTCCNNTDTAGQEPQPPVAAIGQNVISALVSAVNGKPNLSRMRSVSLAQGQCATITWQLHDNTGAPVDLTGAGFSESTPENNPYAVVFRIKEQLSLGIGNAPVEVPATVIDAATGQVTAQLGANMVGIPGIYYGEMALVTVPPDAGTARCVIFSNTFSVIIARSTFNNDSAGYGGPPSIAEIRLHLRDSSPSESFLLDNFMFDDAEIALAITRPVMYWNEIPPPIDAVYTTQNFPFRYHWLEGICANLFMMVAEQFRRNQLGYTAGGMSVDDQNKEANYERAAQARWQAYKDWVRATKASINLEGCYSEVSSTYKYSSYSDAIRIRY